MLGAPSLEEGIVTLGRVLSLLPLAVEPKVSDRHIGALLSQ